MTQEDKELLLKDLCGRLPYRVIGLIHNVNVIIVGGDIDLFSHHFITIKPYLRPMSSMTEEEVKEFYDVECMDAKVGYIKPTWNWHFTINGIDWLNAHHFDYRGLIEKGLALEAPEDMYKL